MRRQIALAVAGFALLGTAGVAGAEVASATKSALPARTLHDVAALRAQEGAVLADLGAFSKLAPNAAVGPWIAKLKSAEVGQTAAEQQLNADLGASPAGAAKSTHTRLTVTGLGLGETSGFGAAKDEQTWRATVTGPGGTPVILHAGEVKFAITTGAHTVATFTTTAANPRECSFVTTITATEQKSRSTAPDLCQGGVGGYFILTGPQTGSPSLGVTASFLGAPGYGPSTSGRINPETVKNDGQPVSA